MNLAVLAGGGAAQTGTKLPTAQQIGFNPLKSIRVPLVEVASAAPATGTTVTRVARILTPGPELALAFGLSFEPTTPVAINSFASAAWTATAMRSGSGEGREARYHAIFTSEVLPQLYTVAGVIPDIEISAALTIPLDGAAAGIPGQWVLEALWGAAAPGLCREDRDFLYNLCAVKAPSARVGLLIP